MLIFAVLKSATTDKSLPATILMQPAGGRMSFEMHFIGTAHVPTFTSAIKRACTYSVYTPEMQLTTWFALMAGIAACIFNELSRFTAALYHRNQVTAPSMRALLSWGIIITEEAIIIASLLAKSSLKTQVPGN